MEDLKCKKILCVGAGGHCRSVVDTIDKLGIYSDIVITDKNASGTSSICGHRVIGNDDCFFSLYDKGYRYAFVTVGSITQTTVRRSIYDKVTSVGFCLPDIIDPSAAVAEDVTLQEGVFVGKRTVINANSRVDRMAIINTGAILEHDCVVGEYSHISVGAVVCGECVIGKDVFVGANSTLIQGVQIGSNSIVGAGSIILADVPENMTVKGVWKGFENK